MASRKTNFSRRKRTAACFLTAIGPVITKTADRKTIMNYHTRGQTRKTVIDYHEPFDQGFSHRSPRSVDDAERGHFTVLFCRERQRNVQRFITHVQSHCSPHQTFCLLRFSLLWSWWFPFSTLILSIAYQQRHCLDQARPSSTVE